MNDLTTRKDLFDGHGLTRVSIRNHEGLFITSEVASVLAYKDTSKLGLTIRQRWGEEFEEGQHYIWVTAQDVHDVDPTGMTPSLGGMIKTAKRVGQVMLLTEEGAYLAALKAKTDAGKQFRRWLSTVRPVDDGNGGAVASSPQSVLPANNNDRLMMRENRLAAKLLHDMAKGARKRGAQNDPRADLMEAKAFEILTGEKPPTLLLPDLGEPHKSPTAIGNAIGVKVGTIGASIRRLRKAGTDLKTAEYSITTIVNGEGTHGDRESTLYNAEAARLIFGELNAYRETNRNLQRLLLEAIDIDAATSRAFQRAA